MRVSDVGTLRFTCEDDDGRRYRAVVHLRRETIRGLVGVAAESVRDSGRDAGTWLMPGGLLRVEMEPIPERARVETFQREPARKQEVLPFPREDGCPFTPGSRHQRPIAHLLPRGFRIP